MSSAAERRAAIPLPPTQSTTPGLGITRLASSTTAAKENISSYEHLYGKRLTLMNEDATNVLYVSFSLSGSTDVSAAASAGTTFALGTTADQGFKLAPLAKVEVCLDRAKHKWIHWDAVAGTPVLAIYPSGHKREG